MLRIILLRPGTTDFDQQGRIKGRLDIPLNQQGSDQAHEAARALQDIAVKAVYCSPCQSAEETAEVIAQQFNVKVKPLRTLQNLDHGLWQGKLIEELKERQRKVYRQWQEQPETVCPPEGEMLSSAQQRVKAAIDKLLKKHKTGIVALVVPEPLASVVRSYLEQSALGDLWKAENSCGSWQSIDVELNQLLASTAS